LSVIHFAISIASTAMIVHVMLIDKKLEATHPAIDLLRQIRPVASIAVLACVAIYFWAAVCTRIPVVQRRREAESVPRPAISLRPEPEEA
jgi:hypothetical protein